MPNEMDINNSAFKVPVAPQRQPQTQPPPFHAESLLFNDIIEEKTIALRNTLTEFLQVESYRKFNIEFSNFLKRTKRIIQEGHRAGANVSRISNFSQFAPVYSRPSTSLNYRPSTLYSMVGSDRSSTLMLPQNSFQPIEPSNPFKIPTNESFQPRVVLPRIDQSYESPTSSTTVINVLTQVNNKSNQTNNDSKNDQLSEPIERPQSPVPVSYSDMTVIENTSVSGSQQNENINNDSNSIESLLEEVGFKIVIGLPNNNTITKRSDASKVHNNQSNVIEHVEKYLSMWSVNLKQTKSQSSSKAVLLLTGNLLDEDKITVLEKQHDAGILEARKDNNVVKTKNGIYRLIGNIIGGSPNELYQACLAIGGIPRFWRNVIKQLSVVEKSNKNKFINFSFDSPAGPIKQKKTGHENMSMTRQGSTYNNKKNLSSQKTNGKRKCSENSMEKNKSNKHRKIEEMQPAFASTPKRPKKKFALFETPSQILKNKLLQNVRENVIGKSKIGKLNSINDSIKLIKKKKSNSRELNLVNDSIDVTKKRKSNSREQSSINDSINVTKKRKSNSREQSSINDSINVTKKRKSISREQTNVFLKPKIPVTKSLNNNSNSSSNNSTKQSKQTSLNNLKVTNISRTQSKNKTIKNSSSEIIDNENFSVGSTKQTKRTSIHSLNSLNVSTTRSQSISKNSSALMNSKNNSVSNTKQAKRKSTNTSTMINISTTQSKNQKLKNASKNTKNSSTDSAKQLKNKSSINSTKTSLNSTKKGNKVQSPKDVTPKIITAKLVKQKKQQEKQNPKQSSKITVNKNANTLKQKTKKLSCTGKQKKKEDLKNESTIKKQVQRCNNSAKVGVLFEDSKTATNCDDNDYFNIMASPGKLSISSRSRTDKSRSETPPLFNGQWISSTKSFILSEPPSPLSKSVEAIALKRVKAPKLTLDEELKNNREKNNKRIDYKTVSNKINKMLEFGEQYDSDY